MGLGCQEYQNKPVIPVEKNSQILINVCRRIGNPTKKKWCAIPSSDEGEMTKTSQSAQDLDRLQRAPIELKFMWRP